MSEYCPSCMAENTDGAEKCSVCGGICARRTDSISCR